jgi:hypothetical protein
MPDMKPGERFREEFHAASAQSRATDVAFLTMVIDALEAGQFAKALDDLRYWRDAIRAMDRAAP